MPTYQYACTECGHQFEKVQSFHDDPITHCPDCDGRVRKVYNAVGVVFKGSGFYRTDSRGPEKSDSSEKSSSTSGNSDTSSGSSKSDSKPDSKPASTPKSSTSTSSATSSSSSSGS